MPTDPMKKKTDAILVLIDVVEYTPQAVADSSSVTREFDEYFEAEITKRAATHGYQFIKAIGDAALLWGEDPDALIEFALDLFNRDRIPEFKHFVVRLRMIANKDYYQFSRDENGNVLDVHGWEAIKVFRSEKKAHINRVLIFPGLYGGLEDHANRNGFSCSELTDFEKFKGMESRTPPCLHLLRPPLPPDSADRELPEAFREARDKLRDSVNYIPVFGELYDPIPMARDFLDLRMERQNTRGAGQTYSWSPRKLQRYLEARHGDDRDLFGDSEADRIDYARIGAKQLFAVLRKGIIAGMPGAGKTTILRHFAYRAFEADLLAFVVFIEARNLKYEHIEQFPERERHTRATIFRILAGLFLYKDRSPDKYTPAEKKAVTDTAAAIEHAWNDSRAVLLLDALDEAPTLAAREWLVLANNLLQSEVPPLTDEEAARLTIEEFRALPRQSCFLSVRFAEANRHSFPHADLFAVNSIDIDQMRRIARDRLNKGRDPKDGDSPLYTKFDAILPWRQDIHRVAGTPLTAQLMVFFYEVYEDFALRYATYELVVLFVLDRAWKRIKAADQSQRRKGANTFFKDVKDKAYLEKRPALRCQFDALGYIARRMLYHLAGEKSAVAAEGEQTAERSISENQLRKWLENWVAVAPKPLPPEATPDAWLTAWREEHIILPAGSDSFAFLHSTVLEFLAASSLPPLIASTEKNATDACSRVFDDRSRDDLEVLPILCSASVEQAARVLARLEPKKSGGSKPFQPDATLPFRCLADTEAVEQRYLDTIKDEDDIRTETARLDATPGKAWAYEHIVKWVVPPHSGTTEEYENWVQKYITALKKPTPLVRTVFRDTWLHDWENHGIKLSNLQERLLRLMLHPKTIEKLNKPIEYEISLLPDYNDAQQPAASEKGFDLLRRFQSLRFMERYEAAYQSLPLSLRRTPADSKKPQLLGLDVAGHGWDNHLAYWRTQVGEVVSGFDEDGLRKIDVQKAAERRAFGVRVNVLGFLGSPNFRVGGTPSALAYSPDGAVAVSGDGSGTLVVWDAATGRELRRWRDGDGTILCVAASAGGAVIVSGHENGAVRIRDGAGGDGHPLKGAGGKAIGVCAITPDGKCVVAVDDDGAVCGWDKVGEISNLASGDSAGRTAHLSKNDARPSDGRGSEIKNLAYVASASRAIAEKPRALLLSPDGAHAVSGHKDGSVVQWSVAGEEAPVLCAKLEGNIWSMALAMDAHGGGWDGQTIVTGYEDGSLRVWRKVGEIENFASGNAAGTAASFSKKDARPKGGRAESEIENLAYFGASFECVATLSGHRGRVRSCAVSPGGAHVLSGGDDFMLRLWDAAKGTPLRATAGHEDSLSSCAVSPDGTRVVTGSYDNTLRIWDAASGESLRTLVGHTIAVRGCVVTPDSRRVVSASLDATLQVWEPESGTPLRTLSGHEEDVNCCAVSPDGKWIVSGSFDDTLRIWEPESGAVRHILSGHANGVYGCAVSPDGRWVASASHDKTVRLWDAERGVEAGTLAEHDSEVWCCAFSPDGRMVASGWEDGRVIVSEALGNEVVGPSRPQAPKAEEMKQPIAKSGAGRPRYEGDPYDAGSRIRSVAYAAEGRVLLAGTQVGELHVLDAATAKRIGVLDVGSGIFGIAVDPRNSRKIYLALYNGTCMVLELPSNS